MADTLLDGIERDALDDGVPVARALRKCVALGGRSGSEALRDWATRELEGYAREDKVPAYRIIPAQIPVFGAAFNGLVQQQPIPRTSLPDFVQEKVGDEVEFREGVGTIEAIVQSAESAGESVKISLEIGSDIARYMNHGDPSQQIQSIYWAVATPAVKGLLDHVRTALTKLVAQTASEYAERDRAIWTGR